MDESLFTYDWVMGGDTIASGLKLNWTVMRTNKMEFNQSGQTSFWLAINNKKSGENWRYYLQNDAGNLLKVTIAQVMAPKVGVFVYEKEDGSVEWGSVKGANAATPEAFTTLYTDIFAHYNAPSRMEGSVVGTAYDGSQLIVYTNQGPDHGAMVQTSEASTNPRKTNERGWAPFHHSMHTISRFCRYRQKIILIAYTCAMDSCR